MKDPTLTPDDPKLTAYALGELSGDERAHIEAELREHPGLRAIVEEIRATAAQIEAALAAEAFDEVDAINGHAASDEADVVRILPGSDPRKFDGGDDYARGKRAAQLLRFPQLYIVLATAAAACFALYFNYRRDELKSRLQAAEAVARDAQIKRAVEAQKAAQKQTAVVEYTPVPAPATVTESANSVASSAPNNVRTPSTPATETPPPSTPAQSENQLALLSITKPDKAAPAVPDTGSPPPSLLSFAVAPTVPPATETGAGVNSLGEHSSAVVTKTSPPAPVVPKLAESNNGATATRSTTSAASAGRVGTATAFTAPNTSPQPNDEIVRLDTFEVNEARVQGFINSSAFTNFQTLTRGMPEPEPLPRPPPGAQFGGAKDAYAGDNGFVRVIDSPTSKFSVDIDTASYANLRRLIEQGTRPTPDAVRIEELVNYFPYGYTAPKDNQAFAAALEVASAPWAPEHRLVRIGLKAREVGLTPRGPANLVFLLDVSASMGEPNKLPLVRDSIRLLVSQLRPDDRVAIVTYASRSVVVLRPTPVSRASEILAALAAIKPSGTAEGAVGLQLAYNVALANFTKNGGNRVILCTDGAFSAGPTGEHQLLQLIDEKTKSGIALTMVGFGRPNEHSTPLERLAHKANATYGYADSRREADKLLVEQVRSSLATIARDVKVQVEFNPAKVLAYRLIGYENRPLRREDYRDETGPVGEVGAGQAVTALYEIVPALPADASAAAKSDYVKYGAEGLNSSRLEMPDTRKPPGNELLTVNVRYKNPNTLLSLPRTQQFAVADAGTQFSDASADFRFAAAVAEFGMILRHSPHRGAGSMRDVIAWANAATNSTNDPRGYRHDFIALARKAQGLVR